jgi:vancomycin resistance protein YoaR
VQTHTNKGGGIVMNFFLFTALFMVINQVDPSHGLTLMYNDRTSVTVYREEFSSKFPGINLIESDKFNNLLNAMEKKVYKQPENATLDGQGNIISGSVGHRLNREEFIELFYSYFFGHGSSIKKVPLIETHPMVDSELLSEISTKQIGHYITYFNSNNKTRTHNISLAVKAINNSVVFPGESFSFNKRVGKRTETKGYLRAPVIVKGELTEGIGGGICQVSSTLFNAVDNAGMLILERYSHSKTVPYVPPGRDATVSWYGPDFSFKNKFNQPILIRVKLLGGTLTVNIYSSDIINNNPRRIPSASVKLPKEKTISSETRN